ncbi:hypothetical protein GOBAR_AA38620 [Gossypium barbadense]|uniref:EF-hand domain-containing protein n=1 Tax=Gossypium barbadense TaxID=3634 RepID=A0A2P5VTD7_GOSBA|nr:hypothetical protein GOBAR_AA38620 [Gossypium barbadense]
MAIKTRTYSVVDGRLEMTMDEFKRWLKKFDDDKDGRISRDELADAIRVSRLEMTMDEFKRWLKKFDDDKDGRISRDELADAIRVSRWMVH